MKTRSLLVLVATMALMPLAQAQKGTLQTPPPKPLPPPPRVWEDPDYRNPFVPAAPVTTQPTPVYTYEQKPVAGPGPLVASEQAQTIINRFKEAYPKLGSPRFLIYVNRELVDEQSGMKLVRRHETIESSRGLGNTNSEPSVRSTGENTYRADGKTAPTLADKQTVRDVERLFGRPLRAAGATLVDQKVGAQLIADRPLSEIIGTTDSPQARKDREALNKIADAVIEILISSKTVTVPTISSSQTITVPDIQATAIGLKDSKVLAQASSTDVTNRVPPASLANYDVRSITEATALALMEDMTPNP
jgi:hypothetical protein